MEINTITKDEKKKGLATAKAQRSSPMKGETVIRKEKELSLQAREAQKKTPPKQALGSSRVRKKKADIQRAFTQGKGGKENPQKTIKQLNLMRQNSC